jgi:dolichyl-diphosphooligosaccharide--protein glycosyltransferase
VAPNDEHGQLANWSIVDPWFNFRATKYLVQNGFYSFWDWFDDRMHPSVFTRTGATYEGHS